MKAKDLFHLENPTWCRGCGLFGIFEALKRAAVSLDVEPEEMVIVTGIGCHGRLNNYFRSYGFHGLHGRVLPVCTGVKLSNPGLYVMGISGDGDAYSIGMGHFLHSVRKNIGMVYLVVNNRVYALTQGQTSPTSPQGFVSISTPFGSKEFPIDGPELALAAGGTFIARGFSANVPHLSSLIIRGLKHRGFALIDILSPCVTHNKINSFDWYKENTYFLDEISSHDPRNKTQAWERMTNPGKIPLGPLYLEEKPSFEELLLSDQEKPLAADDLRPDGDRLKKIMEKFR